MGIWYALFFTFLMLGGIFALVFLTYNSIIKKNIKCIVFMTNQGGLLMNTTELYVEYIIIGLETLCWIILLFFINIGELMSNFLKYCASNIFPSIILMGVCYILGLITDRLSDRIFENRKKKIKQKYPIKAKTSLIVWDKWG